MGWFATFTPTLYQDLPFKFSGSEKPTQVLLCLPFVTGPHNKRMDHHGQILISIPVSAPETQPSLQREKLEVGKGHANKRCLFLFPTQSVMCSLFSLTDEKLLTLQASGKLSFPSEYISRLALNIPCLFWVFSKYYLLTFCVNTSYFIEIFFILVSSTKPYSF